MRISRLRGWQLGFGALALVAVGCEDPLKPGQRLDEPRVLGVRVSNSMDGGALLIPGQAAELEVLVAAPEGPVAARLAYRICRAADSQRDVPYCAENAFAQGELEVSATRIAFDVPAGLAPGARVAVLGVVCIGGEPLLAEEPLDFRCSNAVPPLRLSFDAQVADDSGFNANPDLSELQVEIAGQLIPLSEASVAASCEDTTPVLPPSAKLELRLEVGARAREAGEELQLSHFSTLGELERQYSFISAGAPTALNIEWDSRGVSGAVKQYVVVRDGRGGVSWASFGFCVR
ncbi:MAG: hypothetical protein ACOY0T_07440 [Myxococcota bacterium]